MAAIIGTVGQRRASEKLSGVVGALSLALDIAEGQPEGHAIRSCMIGMRLAEEIGLNARDRSALFYALLLKDLGCSSNASGVSDLFGADDRTIKREFKYANTHNPVSFLPYVFANITPDARLPDRARRFVSIALAGNNDTRELIQIRSERGARIARDLDLPEDAVQAIRNLDEHWNGRGHPDGLRRTQIPLMARILSLSQTAEVFLTRHGPATAIDVVRRRRKTWFDPDLVDAFVAMGRDTAFWLKVIGNDVERHVAQFEPEEHVLALSDTMLDQLCRAFATVVDAKSPWTACHSQGVSDVAVGIGMTMGLAPATLTSLRRAGLLHDIGKLGVSNTILDKPGRLTGREFAVLKKHPEHTRKLLGRSSCLAPVAELAARHHEKLDGSGYGRGLDASRLTMPDRILCVADIYEALAARRPYRTDLSDGEVFEILDRMAGEQICARSVEALRSFLDTSGFRPYQVAA
ncbi:MAG: HD-GYP domain-containing protein [Phycisphaerales bacterium JB060]